MSRIFIANCRLLFQPLFTAPGDEKSEKSSTIKKLWMHALSWDRKVQALCWLWDKFVQLNLQQKTLDVVCSSLLDDIVDISV